MTPLARAVVSIVLAAGCSDAQGMVPRTFDATPSPLATTRPTGCREVTPSDDVQRALDDATVDAVCLAPGTYQGPWQIRRKVALWGPPSAVVRAPRHSLIELTAAGGAVRGLTLDGTGGRFDHVDAGVLITADDTTAEGLRIDNAMFGIVVERCARVTVRGNVIAGSHDPANGLRGDTIRLWETRDSLIADNWVDGGRDVVVWYSRNNRVTNNTIGNSRYGMHFMYSHGNRVIGNRLHEVVVGAFVMYSRDIEVTDNQIANAAGAAGMAIGLKDSGNVTLARNRLVHNTLAIYIDSSPMQRGDRVAITDNAIIGNEAGLVFHSSPHDVGVTGNDLVDNQLAVRIDGGGDALAAGWHANYYDDYAGYDLDGDGVGDVPHELRSLANQLTASHPELTILRGTPALALIDAAGHLDPLYRPRALLVDDAPRMEPTQP